nr:xylulose kinase-1 [Tanacetum cinerariifolium]
MIKVLPLKTAEEVVARERERKARTTLPMALLEDHLAKFHKMADTKEMWEAIKSRFGGNDESKKIAEIDVGYSGNKARDNGRRPAYQDDSKALFTINGEDIDWSGHVEEDAQNYAMMAYSSSNSGSDNEAPKQTSVDESNAKTCENASCESDSSVETTTLMHALVENAPKVVCEPKVWTDAPIIEEYE